MMDRKFGLAVLLAMLAALLLATVAFAGGGPDRLNGRWVAADSVDGSSISMLLAGPPSGPFRVTWRESEFQLCGGTPHGIGRGHAELTALDTLFVELDFECFNTSATTHFTTDMIYDAAAQTLTPVNTGSGATLFTRP